MPEYIWGPNPILETLHSTRQVKRILLAEGQREAAALATILQEAERLHIPTETVPRFLPEHRAAEVNATVVKTSAGATEHLLIAQETNLTRTINFLKTQNIWIVGLA